MGLVQRKTNRCLFLTKLQSRFHAIFLFCPHITSLIVASPVFQTICSDVYSLLSNGFLLYLNLNICIHSKNMYHCFICISFFISEIPGCFQFGLFKTSCHYQIPLCRSKQHYFSKYVSLISALWSLVPIRTSRQGLWPWK